MLYRILCSVDTWMITRVVRRPIDPHKVDKLGSTPRPATIPPRQMKVALVCIAKNEDNYIDEWLDYHLKLGFTKIFLHQNDWRYHGKHIGNDRVQLIEYDGIHKQVPAYNGFMHKHCNNYDWAGFMDIDEFVVLKQHSNILDFLFEYNDYYAVGLNWSVFGSNGRTFDGEYSLIKRFTKCRKRFIDEIKCFVNFNLAKDTLQFTWNPHNVEGIDKTIAVDKSHYINGPWNREHGAGREIAYINHYYTKTREEFRQKMDRGWPLPMPDPKGVEEQYYNERNTPEFNEYEDLTAYNFMYGDTK